jgi:hypothetical protein
MLTGLERCIEADTLGYATSADLWEAKSFLVERYCLRLDSGQFLFWNKRMIDLETVRMLSVSGAVAASLATLQRPLARRQDDSQMYMQVSTRETYAFRSLFHTSEARVPGARSRDWLSTTTAHSRQRH